MFARVTHARYPTEHFTAGLQVIQDSLLPALRHAPGYRGGCFLIHGEPDGGMAVILWDTEDNADAAAVDPAVSAAHVALARLGLEVVARKMHEVIVWDVT